MTVYISVPMTGRTVKEVEADIKQAKKDFAFNKKGTKYISNLSVFRNHKDVGPLIAMSCAYAQMAEVDAVYVCPGWRKSKGCRLEVAAALVYGVPIYGLKAEEADNLEFIIRKKYQKQAKSAKKASAKKTKKTVTKAEK